MGLGERSGSPGHRKPQKKSNWQSSWPGRPLRLGLGTPTWTHVPQPRRGPLSWQGLASRGQQSLLGRLGGRRLDPARATGRVAHDWSKIPWKQSELSSSPAKLWSLAWTPVAGLPPTYCVTLRESLTFPSQDSITPSAKWVSHNLNVSAGIKTECLESFPRVFSARRKRSRRAAHTSLGHPPTP